MKSDSGPSGRRETVAKRILCRAALFRGTFLIDWVMEASGEKASDTLGALEYGLQKGWLTDLKSGHYQFVDESGRADFFRALPARERDQAIRRALEIMDREMPDGPDKALAEADLLMARANGLDGCRRLLSLCGTLRRAYHTAAAFGCLARVVEDLELMADSVEADRLYIEAAVGYSKLSSATSDSERIMAVLKKAADKADRHDLEPQTALLYMHRAKQEWLRSRYGIALRLFNEGWAKSRGIEDEGFQRSIRIFGMFFQYWLGRFREAVENYEQYLPEIDHIPTSHFPLQARLTIGSCYAHCGQISLGLGMLDAAREQGLKTGNRDIAGHAQLAMAVIFFETGRVGDVADLMEATLAQSTSRSKCIYPGQRTFRPCLQPLPERVAGRSGRGPVGIRKVER